MNWFNVFYVVTLFFVLPCSAMHDCNALTSTSDLAKPLYSDTQLIASALSEKCVVVSGNNSWQNYALYTFDSAITNLQFIKNAQLLLVSTQKDMHILSVFTNATVKVLQNNESHVLTLSDYSAKIRWSTSQGILVEYEDLQ